MTARVLCTDGHLRVLVEARVTAAGETYFVDRMGKRIRPDQVVTWSVIDADA